MSAIDKFKAQMKLFPPVYSTSASPPDLNLLLTQTVQELIERVEKLESNV